MEHISVNSSNILSVGHEGNTLQVTFKDGRTYEYSGVSKDAFNKLINAPSVGKHLYAMGIKGVKLEPKKKES
ncbi:MAG: KTSC domain-containing protein [Dehalococcoidia bacterium]|jgi:hypothetical protein